MQTRILGRTDLEVSVMALGAGGKSRLGQKQGADAAESVALVKRALDEGVTLIDTAAAYETEEIVGEAIAGRRDGLVISTKELITSAFGKDDLISADELTKRVEASLKRLRIECADILHLHGVRPAQYDYCVSELLPALERLREAGKIRFTGITEHFVADHKHAMLDAATWDGLFDVVMVGFNVINQTALAKVLPQARAKGVGTLCMYAVRGPLAWLESANALVMKLVERGEVDAADIDRDNPLGFLLEAAPTLSEAAYRFCRHTPGIDVVIAGTGKIAHLVENIGSINGPPLPEQMQQRLTHIFRNAHSETGEPEGG